MHVPVFLRFSKLSFESNARSLSSLAPSRATKLGSRPPCRWWKERACIAENSRWGKMYALWQVRLSECAQDEAVWREEDARRAIASEEAEAVAAKNLERRRFERERRRVRVAAAREVEAQAEEARRSSARASRLESLAALCIHSREVPQVGEPKVKPRSRSCHYVFLILASTGQHGSRAWMSCCIVAVRW